VHENSYRHTQNEVSAPSFAGLSAGSSRLPKKRTHIEFAEYSQHPNFLSTCHLVKVEIIYSCGAYEQKSPTLPEASSAVIVLLCVGNESPGNSTGVMAELAATALV
jgi:hypothetical protein